MDKTIPSSIITILPYTRVLELVIQDNVKHCKTKRIGDKDIEQADDRVIPRAQNDDFGRSSIEFGICVSETKESIASFVLYGPRRALAEVVYNLKHWDPSERQQNRSTWAHAILNLFDCREYDNCELMLVDRGLLNPPHGIYRVELVVGNCNFQENTEFNFSADEVECETYAGFPITIVLDRRLFPRRQEVIINVAHTFGILLHYSDCSSVAVSLASSSNKNMLTDAVMCSDLVRTPDNAVRIYRQLISTEVANCVFPTHKLSELLCIILDCIIPYFVHLPRIAMTDGQPDPHLIDPWSGSNQNHNQPVYLICKLMDLSLSPTACCDSADLIAVVQPIHAWTNETNVKWANDRCSLTEQDCKDTNYKWYRGNNTEEVYQTRILCRLSKKGPAELFSDNRVNTVLKSWESCDIKNVLREHYHRIQKQEFYESLSSSSFSIV